MKQKSEFSFKALNLIPRKQTCASPVAASVRKSQPTFVIVRLNKETAKITQFKQGTIVSLFADIENRALLMLSDQRPTPPGSRKCYGKDGCVNVDLPRQEMMIEWFPVGPIRPLTMIEASHGRLVVQVPTK